MNPLAAVFDGLFLARPMLWAPVWGFCLFGYVRARFHVGDPVALGGWPGASVRALGEILLFSCAVGGVYVLNQMADRDVDDSNPGFALLAHGQLGRPLAVAAAVVYAAVPVVGGLLLGQRMLIAFAAAALVLGIVYSVEPTRFSGRPILDFVSNAVGYGGIAFGMGWYAAGVALDLDTLYAAAPYLLLMGAGSISSTLPDIDGDRRGGKRTTAVVLGPRRAHALATVLLLLSAGAAAAVGDLPAGVCAGLALPFYIVYAVRPTPLLMEATYKVGGTAAMLVVALFVPVFAAAGLLTLLATRIYFKVRFGVRYPSLASATTYAD
ncbi:MAG: hypothetical protein GF331_20030 [Chitinivibrionales bacterium]|nr:hypothetical protein [Chitinivibrionales bacterium]